jgi:hypothetical protein
MKEILSLLMFVPDTCSLRCHSHSLNHAGCVIITSGVFSFLLFSFLDLPGDVICSVARLTLCTHTLALKQQLEIPPLPLLVTRVRLMMMSRIRNVYSFLEDFSAAKPFFAAATGQQPCL